MRAGRADVTTPKLAEEMFVDTSRNCVWFSTLNDSSRNCSRTPPVSEKFLKSARSRLFTPGPRSVFRPTVPSAPAAGCANADVLNHWFTRPVAGVRIPDQIGAVGAEGVVEPAEVGGGDRDREPVLPGVDAVDLPAPDHRVLQAGRVARELLTVAEGQVVDEAADESMVDIEIGQSIIALGVVVVEKALPAIEPARADAGSRRLRIGALGPRVGEGQDRAASSMLQLGVERLVVRTAAPVAVDVGAEVREGLPRVHRLRVRRVEQERLRDVLPHEEIGAVRADVVELERGAWHQLALEADRPLLHVRVPRLR